MVSLGAGSWELVTIQALKALQNCGAICIPTKSADRSFTKSITYKIVKDLMCEYSFEKPIVPLYAPMHFQEEDWQSQVDTLLHSIEKYGSASFVTLGDAGVYSSVYYLLDIIKEQDASLYENCEVIAGVTSFSYASARVKKPLCLGDNRFELIPLLGKKVPSTKVYMRPKIGMQTEGIKEEGELYSFENLNLEGEHIQKGKKEKVKKYMTLFIDFVTRRRECNFNKNNPL